MAYGCCWFMGLDIVSTHTLYLETPSTDSYRIDHVGDCRRRCRFDRSLLASADAAGGQVVVIDIITCLALLTIYPHLRWHVAQLVTYFEPTSRVTVCVI